MTSHNPPIALKGSCLCGSTTYTSTTLPTSLCCCHCTTCRRLSGAPFLPFFDLPSSSISFTSTTDLKTLNLSAAAERAFCSSCGSPVYMKYKANPQSIGICAGTVDENSMGPKGLGAVQGKANHIFVGEKAGWYEIGEDGLRRYERFTDAMGEEDGGAQGEEKRQKE